MFAAALLAPAGLWAGARSCAQVIWELNGHHEALVLPDSAELSPAELAHVVLTARLALVPDLPEDISQHLHSLLDSPRPDAGSAAGRMFVHGNSATGGFLPSIWVRLPEVLWGSPLEFAIRLHEIEHCLQFYLLRQKVGYPRMVASRVFDLGWSLYRDEDGAMKMEWAYLHALAEEQRQRNLGLLAAHGIKERIFLRYLQNGGLTRDEYLARERGYLGVGRYSRLQCFTYLFHLKLLKIYLAKCGVDLVCNYLPF